MIFLPILPTLQLHHNEIAAEDPRRHISICLPIRLFADLCIRTGGIPLPFAFRGKNLGVKYLH